MKIKICCIKTPQEAQMAKQAGADILGLVGPMPSGPGTITASTAGEIVKHVGGNIEHFYLCSKMTTASIIDEYKLVKSSGIQLVDYVEDLVRVELKSQFSDLKIVQVVHVENALSIEKAVHFAQTSDCLLLDSGKPNAALKTLGGTGETHNWEWSKRIVEAVDIPVYLAGGLNANNAMEAFNYVKPFGLDLCSSVRTNDDLDVVKLRHFFESLGKE